ncbi:MAG: hypothetical protein BGO10_00910 [Chlamydia sp. 32-24]|nr:MAG: hypothetical protein BGO10_00910 [Chlamydia sp. 32-24]
MLLLAIKMLIGKRSAFIGVIFGIFLATLLISQQSAIFLGLISRSYRTVTDISAPNLWIIDPATESDDRVRSVPSGYLDVIRSVPGMKWASPINITMVPLVTETNIFEMCQLYGVDDATLIGAPNVMLQGQVEDLRREGGIIVDTYSAHGALAKKMADGTVIPLKLGDELEINHHRAVVVGICKITQGFYPQPIIFCSNEEFFHFTSIPRERYSFIVAKTCEGVDIPHIQQMINSRTKLDALTREEFKKKIVDSFLKTGILINFGLSVALGVIIGFSIAGQIFYSMTVANLTYYALIKAVGGTRKMILQMITLQAVLVGIIGFCLGTAATILWGFAIEDTTLAFMFPWQLLLFCAFIIFTICLSTAILSVRKVINADPKTLMGT